jgi:hypothetical protein
MARGAHVSTKRILIGKANTTIVVAVGVAAFVTAFSLVTARSLLAKRSYQAKVITTQEKARDQLKTNIQAVDSLKVAYQTFVDRPENIIGGSTTGASDKDGDNAKIVLDALPSIYDFPALATSLEKILTDRNYRITAISGTDNEATINPSANGAVNPAQATTAAPVTTTTTGTPQQNIGAAVEMPFKIGAEGDYTSIVNLLSVLQKSIRPIYIDKLNFSASNENTIQLLVEGRSFYQPEKTLKIEYEVVK